jgi:hypothetical protein
MLMKESNWESTFNKRGVIMKVLLFAILFFITAVLIAQPLNSGINFNSTYTALGNGATWTGTAEQLHNNFSYACVTVYSNKSGTLKVAESRAGVSWKSYYKFSYTAGDTVNNKFWVPIQLPWIRVSYTNASSGAQSVFELTTSYSLSSAMATDSMGNLKMSGTFSGIVNVPGVSTSSKQDSQRGVDSTKLTALITNLSATTNTYGANFSTTGTTVDSVSFGFTPHSITFINDGVPTDSLFISPSITFSSTKKITRIGGEGLTKSWAYTKLYFKVGTTPLPSKKIRIEAL